MKKLFTLFVALAAVMSMSAKTIYLQVNDDWKSYGAVFFVHSWGGAADDDQMLTVSENDDHLYSAVIPDDNNNLLFVRAQGECTSIPWNSENLWTQTADLEIPEGKDCYTLTGWTTGEWTKYGEVALPAKFYITGILGSWSPNAIKATTDTFIVENVPAGHHALKVTDGTWDVVKGLSDISNFNKYLYPDQDGNVCFTLSEAANVTVTYIAGEEEVFTVASDKFIVPSVKLVGEGEAFGNWSGDDAIVFADNNEVSASHTFTLAANQHVVFKMIRADDWLSKVGENNTNYGLNRGWPSAEGLTRPGEGETPSLELSADLAGEYTLTWTYATGTLSVTFPEPELENGFYLVGKFNSVDAWTAADLTAAKKFEWHKNVGEGNEEWKITAELHIGDEFKAAYVYLDAITEYIPNDADTKYLVVNEDQAGTKTIYFQQLYNETWGGHFWVAEPDTTTAVVNANANAKAVKRIVNGQIIILRDGKTFNALGAEMR